VKSRHEIAQELVEYHVLAEDGIVHAFRYERSGGDRPDEPVKLLEVSRATVPAGIAPIYFGASRDVPLAVVIIEVTEEEFRELEIGGLALPDGWDERNELHGKAA
jgi:BioD-like phosphotransacetylase family protein